jgi:hypothetical protein
MTRYSKTTASDLAALDIIARRGWLDDYRGDGTLELTEAGERKFFEYLASSEHTRH